MTGHFRADRDDRADANIEVSGCCPVLSMHASMVF